VNSTPPPAPIPAASDRDFAPPQDDHPDAIPTDLPAGPPAALGDPPAVPDGEFPPVGSVLPSFDDLSLQLNLAGWANAASRLFSGLDAAVGLPDAESPWARLGYWALVIGTVGVTVELTRQGLRAKQPEPGSGPPFPVTR
jgi:hypothetical protein